MDRSARLRPLGLQRLRVLDCLSGDSLLALGYFAPAADVDIVDAFRGYVARLARQWATETDPTVTLLIAAARLLTGDLAAADLIVDHLPTRPIKLDHGAGICLVLPFHALATSVPLPPNLRDTTRWLAGTTEQAALRAWLSEHRDSLRWLETDGIYASVA